MGLGILWGFAGLSMQVFSDLIILGFMSIRFRASLRLSCGSSQAGLGMVYDFWMVDGQGVVVLTHTYIYIYICSRP